jgi:ribonuclease Z
MSVRELIILGTAAQVPTRERNHNGYFLRWDAEGILFDPGEGTQRQMTFAEVPASAITHLALTHFHGDHCLGLPGVIQRLSLDKTSHPVHAYFPASGECFFNAMSHASMFQNVVQIESQPIREPGILFQNEAFTISTAKLDHRVDCWGYRIEEPESRSICMDQLQKYNLQGPKIGELKRLGQITLDDGQIIRVEDVSIRRPGQSFAFVMDTRPCENALMLAQNVDILITEATYLDAETDQAHEYMHMTARQAAILAKESGAKKLILSHFSRRYSNVSEHLQQAREVFPNTFAAHDLDHFELPRRIRFS